MANIATLLLREEKTTLADWLERDFQFFVIEKTQWLQDTHGYTGGDRLNVPNVLEHRDWWRRWYEEEKEPRIATVQKRFRKHMNDMYERIWREQVHFTNARKKVLEESGVESATQTFFITIRPDTTKCTFREFYEKVKDVVERKAFTAWTLSFEQKGQTSETLGDGFHVHIVAKTTFRSTPEVLRALLGVYDENKNRRKNGTLASWINEKKIVENCVQVDVCKNPKEHTERYLINYESKDGHKMPTKKWDEKWRIENALHPLYTSDTGLGHLPIKSNRQVTLE